MLWIGRSGDRLETRVLDWEVWRQIGDSRSGLGGLETNWRLALWIGRSGDRLETQVLDWEVWRLIGDSGSGLGGLETDWRLVLWIEGILKEI